LKTARGASPSWVRIPPLPPEPIEPLRLLAKERYNPDFYPCLIRPRKPRGLAGRYAQRVWGSIRATRLMPSWPARDMVRLPVGRAASSVTCPCLKRMSDDHI